LAQPVTAILGLNGTGRQRTDKTPVLRRIKMTPAQYY